MYLESDNKNTPYNILSLHRILGKGIHFEDFYIKTDHAYIKLVENWYCDNLYVTTGYKYYFIENSLKQIYFGRRDHLKSEISCIGKAEIRYA